MDQRTKEELLTKKNVEFAVKEIDEKMGTTQLISSKSLTIAVIALEEMCERLFGGEE